LAVVARKFSLKIYRDAQPKRGWPTAVALVGIFAVLAAAIRLLCRDDHGWSPFWPANGAIVVALLVLPRRFSFFVVTADIIINMMVNIPFYHNFKALFFDALLNFGAALLLAVSARNFCGAATDLSRSRRLLIFMGFAMVSAGVEAGLGVCMNAITRAPNADVGEWFWWTVCDGLGLIIATPAVLLCIKYKRYIEFGKTSLVKRILLFTLILGITVFSFLQNHSDYFIAIYPLLILMAFRAGPAWVLASVLTVAIVASALTVHGYGPLVSIAPSDPRIKENVLQQFLLSLFVCAVPANNVLGEMGRAAQRLRRIHATAREARRAAVAANLAKSQFIANVSHEIRTPLNGVLGMAQILAAGDLSASQRQRVEIIHSSGEVLLSILNDVLDFSKIEAGKLVLEQTPFELVKVVADVQAAFSAVAENKGVGLALRLEGEAVGRLFMGDPTRVRQIASNLVSNALKFTEAGEVQIIVSCCDEGVILSVRDTGIGIPQDKLSKLFGQFEQVDASTTRRFGGSGLGLSICRELCRLMGGRIVVESEVDVGSIFTAHLPLPTVGGRETEQARAPAPRYADPATGALRVLAAEDNKTNQLVLATMLQQMGMTPTLVEDGGQAVEAWREGAFDLILMDMQMPVMDGLTAVRAIRAAEQDSSRLRAPIIAITADVMSHHLENYRCAGIDAVVSKPIQFVELAQAIQSVLDSSNHVSRSTLLSA